MIKKIFDTPSSYKERIQIFEKIDALIALGIICGYFFAMTICGMSVKHVSYSQITFIESLVNICFVGMVLVLVKKRGYGLDSIGLKEGNIKLSLIMGIIPASIFFFCNCLTNIWFEGSEFVSARAIIMYLFYYFTVSIAEELMFRGFLETGLHALTGHIWMDVIITGILFVFIHFPFRMCAYNLSFIEFITDIPYILNLFITHLILSYIRIKSDSLYGAIIPHWVSDFAYAIVTHI